MDILVKIFECNWQTYKKVYKDIVVRALKADNKQTDDINISVELIKLDGNTIQSQRRPNGPHTRKIDIYVDGRLKYIVGLSNTGFDEDKRIEAEKTGGKYVYGNSDWHSNTYLCQGINKIFDYYIDRKKEDKKVKLFFYLLDTKEKAYPSNLSNVLNYRKLATLGFDVLNLDQINFDCFSPLGFSQLEAHRGIAYTSFIKFANDIQEISRKNSGNIPAYLRCVDEEYKIDDEDETYDLDNDSALGSKNTRYIYTFKALGAEAYDSFLTMWTLYVLAQKEHKKLEFLFAPEKWNFRLGQGDAKFTKDFPSPITKLFEKLELDIKYENSFEVLQDLQRENTQYTIAKKKNILRNQELFKNNLRQKGIATKCYLCGCEIEDILQAAHLWGVADIKNSEASLINGIYSEEPFSKMLSDCQIDHKNDAFLRKYLLANSGDNGVWLCSNHHGLFDNHFFCFDSADGKILVDINNVSEDDISFFNKITSQPGLPKEVLSESTKTFLKQRVLVYNQRRKL